MHRTIVTLYYNFKFDIMDFNSLMKEVRIMFTSWLEDETLNEYYSGDVEQLQKEFLRSVQKNIGSDFVIMTQEELHKHRMDWHNSMEGTADY